MCYYLTIYTYTFILFFQRQHFFFFATVKFGELLHISTFLSRTGAAFPAHITRENTNTHRRLAQTFRTNLRSIEIIHIYMRIARKGRHISFLYFFFHKSEVSFAFNKSVVGFQYVCIVSRFCQLGNLENFQGNYFRIKCHCIENKYK